MQALKRLVLGLMVLLLLGAAVPVFADQPADNSQIESQLDWRFHSPRPGPPSGQVDGFANMPPEADRVTMPILRYLIVLMESILTRRGWDSVVLW